jgi:hypothetical protein
LFSGAISSATPIAGTQIGASKDFTFLKVWKLTIDLRFTRQPFPTFHLAWASGNITTKWEAVCGGGGTVTRATPYLGFHLAEGDTVAPDRRDRLFRVTVTRRLR